MGMNHQMNSIGMGSMNQQQGMVGMGPGNCNPMMNNGPDMSHNMGMGQPGNFPNNQYHPVRLGSMGKTNPNNIQLSFLVHELSWKLLKQFPPDELYESHESGN